MFGGKVLSFPPTVPASFLPCLKPYCRFLKPFCNSTATQTLTMKTLDEADVGILCYISRLPGFRGVLKQRFESRLHLLSSSSNLSLSGFLFFPSQVFRFYRKRSRLRWKCRSSDLLRSASRGNFSTIPCISDPSSFLFLVFSEIFDGFRSSEAWGEESGSF